MYINKINIFDLYLIMINNLYSIILYILS